MPQWTPLTRSISLRQLCPGAKFFGADDIVVSSIAADSREVAEGDLFAALSGTRTDGHHHIDEALQRGAVAVLAERFVPTDGRPLCVVPDTSRCLRPHRTSAIEQSEPTLEGDRRHRHQRKDIHKLAHPRHSRSGRLPDRNARHDRVQRRRMVVAFAGNDAARRRARAMAVAHGNGRLHTRGDGSVERIAEPGPRGRDRAARGLCDQCPQESSRLAQHAG